MQPSRLTVALLAAGLLCLTVGVFERVRNHDFADLDDLAGIQLNDELEVQSLGEAFRKATTDPLLSNWMPATVLSHQLDRWLYGSDAGRQLLTNVALHAASTVLLLLALVSLTGAVFPSAFVAAVFAVHPLHVETVAWVSERKGALSGLFFMLTLLSYAHYVKNPTRRSYAAVLTSLGLALLSKPTTVTLPCVLLLLDVWPLRRLDWRAVREKLPMFAMVAAVAAATFYVQQATGAMSYGDAIPSWERLTNALAAYATYLGKSVWPSGLAAFYAFPATGPDLAASALGGVALLGVTALTLWLREDRPYLLVGWLWFVGMLVPMLGLVQVGAQSHADRYLYLPLIGLSIAFAWGVCGLARAPGARRVVAVAGALAIALLALGSWHQLGHWRDGFALWGRVLEVAPGDWRALVGLGSLHARRIEFEEAEAYYLEAYEREPARTRNTLRTYFLTKASHLRRRNDPDGALESQRRAVQYDPNHPSTQAGLGLALADRGSVDEARPYLERAVQLDPRNGRVLLVLAADAEAAGRIDAAIAYRRQLHRVAPTRASNVNNLAWLLATAPNESDRDPEEAVALAERLADASEAPSANLLDTLGTAYAADGRFDEAAEVTRRAVDQARAAENLALALVLEERLALYLAGEPYREVRSE